MTLVPTAVCPALGRAPAELTFDEEAELSALRALRKLRREEALRRGVEAAALAATHVARSAQLQVRQWQLDPVAVVYGLTRNARTTHVVFVVANKEVAVERQRLIRLGRIAKRLPGLICFVDHHALSFRWRGGRGGLNLKSSDVYRPEQALRVVLTLPRRRMPAVLSPEFVF